MKTLLVDVAEKENIQISEEVRDRIIEVAEGSPRKALVLLNQVMGLSGEEEQLAVVLSGVSSAESIELCRILLSGKAQWSAVAKILKVLQDDPEGVRRHVLAYAASVLLNSGSSRAYDVICAFERDYFASGKAGLAASCFEVVGMGTKKPR
jgi:DNA polymerase III gamma/tau subunit